MLISTLICCTTGSKKDTFVFKGLWFDESKERFWFVKDSLIIFYPFYPYSKWEIDQDTLKTLDLGSLHLDTPNWFKYSLEKLTEKKVYLKSLEQDEESYIFQRITSSDNNDYLPKKISLQVADCAYGSDCVDLSVDIYMSDRKMNISEAKESSMNYSCFLDPHELLAINYLVSKVDWGEINKPMLSNEMHTKYFRLNIEFEDSGQDKIVLSDTGEIGPSSIDNLITFIWATSQLKCKPFDYQRDIFIF